jgi:hypothetical protein
MEFGDLEKLYDGHVDGYRAADGSLPEMMALKREHTARVVRHAERIAVGEGFDARTREAVRAAALLHDTGRYEQLRRWGTFRDSESADHAVLSHDTVKASGWLDDMDGEMRSAVLAAVLYHNRRELPEGLDALAFASAHTVRDADKLDIFRVLEDRVAKTDWRTDTRAFWNLPVCAPPNPAVVSGIEAGEPVDYGNIRSIADFVLIQVGWMISDLHYATSRRICVEGGHLEFRRRFLHELTDDSAVDRLCDMAEAAMRIPRA